MTAILKSVKALRFEMRILFRDNYVPVLFLRVICNEARS